MQPDTRPLVVMVAPLNWGLGHATRCIPLIHTLQELGCEVITASDGASRALLVEEFPQLTHLCSPHTVVRYSRYRWLFGWAMLKLLPLFWLQWQRERKWIRSMVDRYRIDAILSDNRYGLAHPSVTSVFITHQLEIRTGYGRIANRIMQRILYRLMDRFQQIWVPDTEATPSLAGALSHPHDPPTVPIQYIGVLNRLAAIESDTSKMPKQLLVLLSGPEPQRSLLEAILLKQVASLSEQLVLVRGLPATANAAKRSELTDPSLSLLYGPSHIKIFDHLTTDQLQQLLPSVEYIICRSGYTTLMEMIPLQKKLLLIPTPGQPEQTYLASYADSQQYAPQFSQQGFSIEHALRVARQYPYRFPAHFEHTTRQTVVARFVDQLRQQGNGSR